MATPGLNRWLVGYPRVMLADTPRPVNWTPRWHENTVVAVVALVLCWVVGLVLVWVKRQWTTTTKVVITPVVGAVLLGAVALSAIESNPDRAADVVSGNSATLSTATTLDAGPILSVPPPAGDDYTRDEVQQLLFPVLFDSMRSEVIEVGESEWLFDSVNTFDFDTDTGDVTIDLVPAYDFDAGVRDDARLLTEALALLWGEEGWCDASTGFAPGFDVIITTARYRCDADTVLDLNAGAVTRGDWERRCRIR